MCVCTKSLPHYIFEAATLLLRFGIYFSESREGFAIAGDGLEEHLFWTNPVLLLTVERLIDYHAFLGFRIEGDTDITIVAALEMAEVSDAICRQGERRKQLLYQWYIIRPNLFCRRSVRPWEVERAIVMLQERRLEVRQRIMLAKEPPHAACIIGVVVVKLSGFQFCKLPNQSFINNEMLVAILAGRLVLMLTNTLGEELRHPEMRIAQQCRHAYDGREHLGIERTATVPHQQVRLLAVTNRPNLLQGLLRMDWQIGCQHLSFIRQRLTQGQSGDALTACKEPV